MRRFIFLSLLFLTVFFSGSVQSVNAEASNIVETAKKYIGDNSNNYSTFRFVHHVFMEAAGVYLPPTSQEQFKVGTDVARDDLQPGDVLFFQGNSLMSAIHLEDGTFIIVTTSGIETKNLNNNSYWESRYVGAKRYDGISPLSHHPIAERAYEMKGDNPHRFSTFQFVQHVFSEAAEISLPHSAQRQFELGNAVEKADLQPGDIMFFKGNSLMSAIHIGHESFIIVTSSGIKEVNLHTSPFWSSRYVGAKRIDKEAAQTPETDDPIVQKAMSLIGTPYNADGQTPEEGFSTGTFVHYVYKEVTGSLLSKYPERQLEAEENITRENLKPGDLVFFNGSTHVLSGIYKGNGLFIIVTSSGVKEQDLRYSTYWSPRFIGGARYTDDILKLSHPETYKNDKHPAIREAVKYVHTPYLFNGNTLEAFDCSFLIQTAFRDGLNVHLPRSTENQWLTGETILPEGTDISTIDLDDHIRPGDVLFFSNTWQPGVSHAGIYLGHNFMIHASNGEKETTITYINEYWHDHFTGVKRVDNLTLLLDNPTIFEVNLLLGTPYVSGGTDPSVGFDTGGFVQYVYKKSLDLELPRYGSSQWNVGSEVDQDELQLGDVVFFQGSTTLIPSIYAGNDQVVLVSQSNGVSIVNLQTSDYWSSRYYGARTYE